MDWVTAALGERRRQGGLRELRPLFRCGGGQVRLAGPDGDEKLLFDFSSNDYLAYAEHPEVVAASRQALAAHGAGAGAARLMSGDSLLQHLLEEAIARLKGKEGALIFGSGFLANVGVIPAIAGRGDAIFADRLVHASIYDGCRLSAAKLFRFRHNDLDDLETLLGRARSRCRRALIAVESLYSMDGDRCPLRELAALKEKHDCLLLVDEAHATGIFGRTGAGLLEEEGVAAAADIIVGTFGKALGSYGAYVAAAKPIIGYLVNFARSFIYSTALPPAVLGASLAAVRLLADEPRARADLLHKAEIFRGTLQEGGLVTPGSSQIVPVVVGESERALALMHALAARGFHAAAVRPPTVPAGTARLRFSITRHLADEAVLAAAHAVVRLMSEASKSPGS